MPTIRELLRGAAAVPHEPLDWDRVRALGRRRRVARQAGAIVVAVVVMVGAGVALVVSARPSPTVPITETTGGPSPAGPFDDLATGWTSLPAPPEGRDDAATQWTGQMLLIWGGRSTAPGVTPKIENDGMVFDPQTSTWSEMAPSPLAARRFPSSAWTGTELLVWGGLAGTVDPPSELGDGAAYDPRDRIWRPLPPAPIGPRAPLSVWTGEELIVWGTAVRAEATPRDGAAYRLATDTWRRIADAPIELNDGVAVWTGREMIVFGAKLTNDNASATPTAIGAAYDPARNTWRTLPTFELRPEASTAVWNGHELIAWDYEHEVGGYDPDSDTWRSLPGPFGISMSCNPRSVRVGAFVVAEYCGGFNAFDGVRWGKPSRAAPDVRSLALVPAGPVVLMLSSDVTTDAAGLFAYRPGP